MTACDARKQGRGTVTVLPRIARTMPASIGPSSMAAGTASSSSNPVSAIESASSAAQRVSGGRGYCFPAASYVPSSTCSDERERAGQDRGEEKDDACDKRTFESDERLLANPDSNE